MKKLAGILMGIVILFSVVPFCLSCKEQPIYWQQLQQDKVWTQNLNQYLALSYTEQQDRAGFYPVPQQGLSPSLHSTYEILTLLHSINVKVENSVCAELQSA
jgi:hypothetical protein